MHIPPLNSSILEPDAPAQLGLNDCRTFREVAEFAYYSGYVALNPIIQEIIQYHESGHAVFHDSEKLIEYLTDGLGGALAYDDLYNSVAVLLSDLIHRDGRDKTGEFCAETLARAWGASAGQAVRRLVALDPTASAHVRPRTPYIDNELVRFVTLFCPDRVPEFVRTDPIPDRLPLLDKLTGRLGEHRIFSGAIAVQHVLGSTAPLLQAIASNLMDSGSIYVLGKPYSTNHATMWRLREQGLKVHDFSWKYDALAPFEPAFELAINDLIGQFIVENQISPNDESRKFLLLDDGGKAISVLHSPRFRKYASAFRCVEQTRRGARIVRKLDLLAPVVNVAESWVKLEHESPMIAHSVIHEMRKKLDDLRRVGVDVDVPAGVIGLGAIGAATVHALQAQGWPVVGYDSDSDTVESANFECVSSKEELFQRCRLLIGCSGETALDRDDFAKLQNHTILVSASSSDVEFSAWHLRAMSRQFSRKNWLVDANNLVFERVGTKLLLLGDLDHACHMLHIASWAGKKLYVVNGGFPVNFTGEVDPIAPDDIQLTRALLYAGCSQAVLESQPTLIDLDEASQRFIYDASFSPDHQAEAR